MKQSATDKKITPMSSTNLVQVVMFGAITGLIAGLLYLVLHKYVFSAVLCKVPDSAECANTLPYSVITTQIIALMIGVSLLIKLRVYRPLLVSLATLVALWGLPGLIDGVSWIIVLITFIVLYALGYGLFAWLARLRSFGLSFVLTLVVVIFLIYIAR